METLFRAGVGSILLLGRGCVQRKPEANGAVLPTRHESPSQGDFGQRHADPDARAGGAEPELREEIS